MNSCSTWTGSYPAAIWFHFLSCFVKSLFIFILCVLIFACMYLCAERERGRESLVTTVGQEKASDLLELSFRQV